MTNPTEKMHELTRPEIVIINSFTTIALIYCVVSAYLFREILHYQLLEWVHVFAFIATLLNYAFLLWSKNFRLATHVILAVGTVVVTSLFATGGWEMTGYLWPFAYLPYAFFLASDRSAFFWVILLYALCFLISILAIFGIIFVPYSAVQLGNYLAALAVFITCMFFVVQAQRRYAGYMSEKGTEILKANEMLVAEVAARKTIQESLENQSKETKRINDLLVDRELRMVELKKEVEELKRKSGEVSASS